MAKKDRLLTEAQRCALEGIAEFGDRGATGRQLAQKLWPDSPAWEKTTRSRPGFQGSKGGTMPMKGARAARALADLGLVLVEYNDVHQPFFSLSTAGKRALDLPADAELTESQRDYFDTLRRIDPSPEMSRHIDRATDSLIRRKKPGAAS